VTHLIAKLNDLLASGTPIGFCPWEDGEGILWGRVIEVNEKTVTFQEIGVFGREEEVSEYELSSILYFDDVPAYAERLEVLSEFNPSLPDEVEPITESDHIESALTEAFITGEVVGISFPGTELIEGSVERINSDHLELSYFDDLGREKGRYVVKLSVVTEVIWRNSKCEAETFLKRRAGSLDAEAH
jgi:hypothetical protein